MQGESDWTWLDARRILAPDELAGLCRLTVAEIEELVEYGGLVPLAPAPEGGLRFGGGCIAPLREATRLRADFDLDLFTVSLLLPYLQRIEDLQYQLRALKAQLPHRGLAREGPGDWREPHGTRRLPGG